MKKLNEFQFETVLKTIYNNLNYPFDSSKAEAFGVTLDDDYSVKITPIASDGDIYNLINYDVELKNSVKLYDLITFATCGWAAPIDKSNDENNEVAPSKHPERRRVRLLTTASINNQFGSSISFKDNPDEPVFDFGNARGALADAIKELINSAAE